MCAENVDTAVLPTLYDDITRLEVNQHKMDTLF